MSSGHIDYEVLKASINHQIGAEKKKCCKNTLLLLGCETKSHKSRQTTQSVHLPNIFIEKTFEYPSYI